LEVEDLDPATQSDWKVVGVALRLGGTQVPLVANATDKLIWTPKPEDLRAATDGLPGKGRSEIEVTASLNHDGGVALIQTLRFPLRWRDGLTNGSPMRPALIRFEDPEYNRALTSTAKLGSAEIQVGPAANPQTWTITAATDRRAYNPNSTVYIIWDASGPEGGSPPHSELTPVFQRNGGSEEAFEALARNTLTKLPLHALDQRLDRPTRAGDRLSLLLKTAAGDTVVQIDLDIVATPVDPMPESVYALLRDAGTEANAATPRNDSVECIRYAHGPRPARIELVNGRDLLLGVARRRAVFLWRDMVRRGLRHGYAMQKWSSDGATHIPDRSEFRRAT